MSCLLCIMNFYHIARRSLKFIISVLRSFVRQFLEHCREIDRENSWVLHRGNANSQSAIIIREVLIKPSTNTFSTSSVFIWYATVWLYLISKVEIACSLSPFYVQNSIKENSLRILKAFHRNDFKSYFNNWKKRWKKCIVVGGDYFREENSLKFDQ